MAESLLRMKIPYISILITTGICLLLIILMTTLSAQAAPYSFSSSFGSFGNTTGQFSNPAGIAVNSTGFIFVADLNNNRIQIFDSSGNWRQTIGGNDTGIHGQIAVGAGSANGQFYLPQGIAVNSTGFIFVADQGNNRVQIFDSSGNWKQSFGTPGSEDGEFRDPYGIAVNSTGFIFVDDEGNSRIQIFDSSGNWRQIIGGKNHSLDSGQFSNPAGIAVNSTGFIFVADSNNNRIQIFDSSGNWKQSFGTLGSENGEFTYPSAVAVNSTGSIFVVDTGNSRVQIFDSSGNWKQSFGIVCKQFPCNAPGQFQNPHGIAVNSTGFIFVADTENDRIQIFSDTMPTTTIPATSSIPSVPEFPLAIPILLISISAMILFYRKRSNFRI